MKQKSALILGTYDMILALGAIYCAILMVSSKSRIFSEYPVEWLSKLPFKSWLVPGIITIVVFGLGNIVAALFSFKKNTNKSWFASALIGGFLFICVICQVLILGEWYLASVELLIFSIVQLLLSGFSLSQS